MRNLRITLTDLARLGARMSADTHLPLRDLQSRDREIGTAIFESKTEDNEQTQQSSLSLLLQWLDKTEPQSPTYNTLAKTEPAIALWLSVIGLVFGVLALSGLILVESKQPVNVLMFLTVFIGIQWILLALTVLVGTTAIFNLSPLHLPFENLNPAKLLFRRAVNQFSHRFSDSADGSMAIAWEYFSNVIRLALLRWGQLFGVAFNVGGIIAFLVVLAFTDRNFGWSSTFNISGENLFRFIDAVAIPWKSLFPDATVTVDIINNTRYQFLQNNFSDVKVESMRAWWPFLLATIIFYGLLPRVLLWMIFKYQFKKKAQYAFVAYPGARLVIDRMRAPIVSTQSASVQADNVSLKKQPVSPPANSSTNVLVMNWVDAIPKINSQEFLAACGFPSYELESAGLDLTADKNLIATLDEDSDGKSTKNSHRDIVIAVKSWEPPLEELSDFITSIFELSDSKKGGTKNTTTLYLLLVPLKNKKITKDEAADWRNFASSITKGTVWVLNATASDDKVSIEGAIE